MKILGLCLALCSSSLFPAAAPKLGQAVPGKTPITAQTAAAPAAQPNQAEHTYEYSVATASTIDSDIKTIMLKNEMTGAWIKKITTFKRFKPNQEVSNEQRIKTTAVDVSSSDGSVNMTLVEALLSIEQALLAQNVLHLHNLLVKQGILFTHGGVKELAFGSSEDYVKGFVVNFKDDQQSAYDQKSKQ